MKKAASMLLVIICLFSLMSISVFAADTGSAGVYDLKVEGGYTLIPKTANGTDVTAQAATVDGKSVQLYEGAERFTVNYSASEGYHLVLMLSGTSQTPVESNIWYIDQASPENGTVTFGIYPKAMQKAEYHVYLSSSDGKGLMEVASFKYSQPYMLGDVDETGSITSIDALAALRISVGDGTWKESQHLAADVDKSGSVTSTDALWILEASVGNREL